jgi:hypothetical protein
MNIPTDGQSNAKTVSAFGDERDTVRAQAMNSGVEIEEIEPEGEPRLVVKLANGKKTRRLTVTSDMANTLSRLPFGNYVTLGGYDAYLDKTTGLIEAAVQINFPFESLQSLVRRLPGLEPLWQTIDGVTQIDWNSPLAWRMPVESAEAPFSLELSPATDFVSCLRFQRLPGPSLKIFGFDELRHDAALEALENVSTAFFFELDLHYRVRLNLARSILPPPTAVSLPTSQPMFPVQLPRKKYSKDAVALYSYGRSATGMPLLQFLAYYQCIEYYFPLYWRAELIARVKQTISESTFEPGRDEHINRLIGLVTPGRGGWSERKQLRATVDACVGEVELREFISKEQERSRVLTTKDEVKGVEPLCLEHHNNSLTRQVANRIYDLRCKIVHSKEDGGPSAAAALIPSSNESERIIYDVQLVELVAQKVIIAGKHGSLW